MAQKRLCFVIMPIRRQGSDEYQHFRALHDTVIKPTLRELEYEVLRADDITKSGAITRDIVEHLATADLVIADLTDLNPNVFYELGIRHALRGQGTVMIVDTSRTEVPFDLKPYRVIEFNPNSLMSVQSLRDMLIKFVSTSSPDVRVPKDNPVHDFLSALPVDVYKHAEGSTEGKLREENAKLKELLRRYGVQSEAAADGGDLVDIVAVKLGQAQREELPSDLVARARNHAREKGRTQFLAVLQQLLDAGPRGISSQDLLDLSYDATALGLEDVAEGLHSRAIQLRPNDKSLRRIGLARSAHSDDPRKREYARQGLLRELGISTSGDGTVEFPPNFSEGDLGTLAMMLDAYHSDDLDDEALRITDALVKRFPDKSIALRNQARALAAVGKVDLAMSYYKKAVDAPDASDTSAVWLGNHLSGQGDILGAARAYLIACQLDPDDATNFAHVADSLAQIIRANEMRRDETLEPVSVEREEIIRFLSAAFSCPMFTQDSMRFVEAARETAELPFVEINEIQQSVAASNGDTSDGKHGFVGRAARIELARKLADILREE